MTVYFVSDATGSDSDDGLSEGDAFLTIDKAMNTAQTGGDKVWIKADGDYTETATIDVAGGATAPIIYEGYTSTTGDGGKCTIDGESSRSAGITTAIGSADYHYVFKNILVKNTTGHGFDFAAGDAICFKNCEADNTGDVGFKADNSILFEECLSHGNSSTGFFVDNNGIYVGCIAFDNAGGFRLSSGPYAFCVAYGNTGSQFYVNSGEGWYINCTADGENVASTNGFRWNNSGVLSQAAVNCIAHDLATGFSSAGQRGELSISRNNLVNSNVANYASFVTHTGEVAAVPGFTDEASVDYTLTSSSAAKAAGFDGGEQQA